MLRPGGGLRETSESGGWPAGLNDPEPLELPVVQLRGLGAGARLLRAVGGCQPILACGHLPSLGLSFPVSSSLSASLSSLPGAGPSELPKAGSGGWATCSASFRGRVMAKPRPMELRQSCRAPGINFWMTRSSREILRGRGPQRAV